MQANIHKFTLWAPVLKLHGWGDFLIHKQVSVAVALFFFAYHLSYVELHYSVESLQSLHTYITVKTKIVILAKYLVTTVA